MQERAGFYPARSCCLRGFDILRAVLRRRRLELATAVLAAHLVPIAKAETILILPFFNLSKSKNVEWIGDSISETILDAVGSNGLDVIRNEPREQALKEMGVRRYSLLTQASVAELAATLSAEVAVYGEFDVTRGADGQSSIRLKARILQVRRVKKGKEFEVSGALEQLSRLQSSLAWQVVTELGPVPGLSEESFRRSHPAVRLDALENYVRGLLTPAADQRLKFFAAATRLEPSFALAQYHLGLTLYQRRDYRSAGDALSRVPADSMRAREALFFHGLARYQQGDFHSAIRSWRALASQVPMAEVFNNLGAAELRAGEATAVTSLEKAVETDPSDPDFHFNLGYAYWRAGQFDRSAESLRRSLERRPDDELATLLLGRCLQRVGPRPGDLRTEAVERLKTEYNDAAFLALKAILKEER